MMPQAVARGRDGYLRVYYEQLGLRLQSWSEWLAEGGNIPTTVSYLRKALRFAIVGVALAIAPGPVLAQSKPSTDSREASGAPTEAALAVGAPQIGSVANLEVAGFDIAVTAGSIVYSYYFRNKGNADLAVVPRRRCPNSTPAPTAARPGRSPGTTRRISSI